MLHLGAAVGIETGVVGRGRHSVALEAHGEVFGALAAAGVNDGRAWALAEHAAEDATEGIVAVFVVEYGIPEVWAGE